jgi:fructose-1,6-bisphosphatase/inositol monophosphatase family enzyme
MDAIVTVAKQAAQAAGARLQELFGQSEVYQKGASAGKLLIEEAGGRCSDRAGRPLEIQSGHVVASNHQVFPDLLDTVAWPEDQ